MSGGGELELVEGVKLLPGLPAVYLKKHDAVVIADLHLGYEEAMARQGVFLPRLQMRKAERLARRAREFTGASVLIVAGDIKHEFGRLLRSEKLETARFLKSAFDAGYRRIIVVRGNHDNYISHVVESLGGEFIEDLDLGEVLVTHGHKKLDPSSLPDIVIIGHEHPSISVDVGGMRARFPALLMAPLPGDRILIVLPAAGMYQTGNPVGLDSSSYLSPLVREHVDPGEITPIIIDEKEGLLPLPKLSLLYTLL